MADKGDKDIAKPSPSSNPFLLPTSPATSQSSRKHTSYTPGPFSGVSSTCFTSSRNDFSGCSPDVSSINSNRFCITSLSSDSLCGSVVKTEISGSFSTSSSFSTCVSTKSSVICEAGNTLTKSGGYSSVGNTNVCEGTSDTSVPATKASDTVTATMVGDTKSEFSSSPTTKNGHDTGRGYGGNFEKTAGVITMSSSSHTFGDSTKSSSSGSGKESSQGPRLFSGIPSCSLASKPTESTTEEVKPKVTSDSVSSQSSISATLSGGSLQKGQISGSSGNKHEELKEEQESHTEEVSGKNDGEVTEPASKESELEKKLEDVLLSKDREDNFRKDDDKTILGDHESSSHAKIPSDIPEMNTSYATPAKRKSEDDTDVAMESKRKAIKTQQ